MEMAFSSTIGTKCMSNIECHFFFWESLKLIRSILFSKCVVLQYRSIMIQNLLPVELVFDKEAFNC